MLSTINSPPFLLKSGMTVLFIHGLCLLLYGVYEYVTHDWSHPHYDHFHTHELCTILTYELGYMMIWYASIITLILITR